MLGTAKPVGLSKINTKLAQAVVKNGLKDKAVPDDVIDSAKSSILVAALKPAQTEIIKEKAFGLAIGMLLDNKWKNQDLGCIISKDNYIMDGHHRWAAISLIDPKEKVEGTVIDLPGGPLVTALNLVTVGKLGITQGNQGHGNIAEFTGKNFAPIIDEALQNGIKGEFPIAAKKVKEALGKIPGANGDVNKGKALMMYNADVLPKQIMPGAPARVEMPVIDTKNIKMVQSLLKTGKLDIYAPYSVQVKAMKAEESFRHSINSILSEITKK